MKTASLVLLFLFASLFVSGCSSTASPKAFPIQAVLNATLPPDFTGSAHVDHKNVWFDFSLDFVGLRKTDAGWTWTDMKFHRNGRASTGNVTLSPNPKP